MNRNLVLFSFFLVVLGLGFGFYLLSFFGLLLLIPAFVMPSRTGPRPVPQPAKEEPRRIVPPPAPHSAPTPIHSESKPQTYLAMPPPQSPYQPYSPALFPTAIFPTLSVHGDVRPPAAEGATKPSERDELIETGAMLALLRILLG